MPSRRDPAEIDGSLAYVTATELHNAYVEWMRRLDRELWPAGRTPQRDEMIQFFESFRLRLLTRAQTRIPTKPPPVSAPKTPEIPTEDTERAAHEARQARLSKYRDGTQ